MHGVRMNFQGGVESRPIILVLYGRTHTLMSNGCTPAKIRCFCAVSGDGNVQSAVISPGTVICKLTACRRRFVSFVLFVSFVSFGLCGLCGLVVHVFACPQTRLRMFWNQCIAPCIHLHRGRTAFRKFQLHGHLMPRGYPVRMWLSGLRLGLCGLVTGRRRIRIMSRPASVLCDAFVECR